ncbi:MAG: ATP-binding cassette domain-containing protein, partial [Candidatus Sumerlaeaceae bacterium]|nr:ATP-binding cassette domain-containing protein [Candidatus Sumerlaeaceae bacterium]
MATITAQSPIQLKAQETTYAIEAENLNIYYGSFHAVKNVTLRFPARKITALIGPSGCGKRTVLRAFNRMNDFIKGARITG